MNYPDIYYGTPQIDSGSLNILENLFNLGLGIIVISTVLSLAIRVFRIVCDWKLFKKAGKPGWAAIVPIYNTVVLFQISGLSGWSVLLLLIPFVNIYILFKQNIELAKRFGQGVFFGVIMVFFQIICMPILALGKSQYRIKNEYMENQTFNNQIQNYNTPKQETYNPTYITPAPQRTVSNEYIKTFCPNCGEKLATGISFCPNCGEKL